MSGSRSTSTVGRFGAGLLGGLFLMTLSAAAAPPEPSSPYKVTGVALSDVLNVRLTPDAEGEKIGSLPANTTDVIVTGAWQQSGDSSWWQIVYGHADGGTGWINAKFLTAEPGAADVEFPLECFGTEPFWSLRIADGQTRYSPNGEEGVPHIQTFEAGAWLIARGFRHGYYFVVPLGKFGAEGSVVVIRAYDFCSDNMSDISYSFYGTVVLPDGHVDGGCCIRGG